MDTTNLSKATAYFRDLELNNPEDKRWGEFGDALDQAFTYIKDSEEVLKKLLNYIGLNNLCHSGRWEYVEHDLWKCSECGDMIYSESSQDRLKHHLYCSKCGAKMNKEDFFPLENKED